MSDEWRDLDRRVNALEQAKAVADERYAQTNEKFLRIERLGTDASEKLDKLISRSNFLDGEATTKGKVWKGVLALILAALSGSFFFELLSRIFTGKWN